MSLKSDLIAIQKLGKKQKRSEDFISFAILFWMETQLDVCLKKMNVAEKSIEKETLDELRKFLVDVRDFQKGHQVMA